MDDSDEIIYEIGQDESLKTIVLSIISPAQLTEVEYIDSLKSFIEGWEAGEYTLFPAATEIDASLH